AGADRYEPRPRLGGVLPFGVGRLAHVLDGLADALNEPVADAVGHSGRPSGRWCRRAAPRWALTPAGPRRSPPAPASRRPRARPPLPDPARCRRGFYPEPYSIRAR